MTLEQLARERGVLWSDRTTSCVAKTPRDQGKDLAIRLLKRSAKDDNHQCVVPALNMMSTSSFALYTFSLATFIQFLTLVSFGSVADYG